MQQVLVAFAILATGCAAHEHCPGSTRLGGYGTVQVVPTGWENISVTESGSVVTHMNGRAYLADTCTAGHYSNEQYLGLNLLGKTMRYTVDLAGAGCGCNAALYLTAQFQNTHPSEGHDYYCDANAVGGVRCAEIDIQEANMHAWHSTLHTKMDSGGEGGGIGGGGPAWNGPREWTAAEYGRGGRCVDTDKPFNVAASFPVDEKGMLQALQVELSQDGSECPLRLTVSGYRGMEELTEALAGGMTPVVSYWRNADMLWLDGEGKDHQGPCAADHPKQCSDRVQFYNLNIEPVDDSVYAALEKAEKAATTTQEVVWWKPSPTTTEREAVKTTTMTTTTTTTTTTTEAILSDGSADSLATRARLRGALVHSMHRVMEMEREHLLRVDTECHAYLGQVGCGWTQEYSCPGQKLGTSGTTENDGSLGWRCCCHYEMWMEEVGDGAEDSAQLEQELEEGPRLCSASFGAVVGGGRAPQDVCPEAAPTCVGYVQGEHLGTCQVARPWQQCGGKNNGRDWQGPRSCTKGWVCKDVAPDYSQCIKEPDVEMVRRKERLFSVFGGLVVEGQPQPGRLVALVAALAVAGAGFHLAVQRAACFQELASWTRRMRLEYTGLRPAAPSLPQLLHFREFRDSSEGGDPARPELPELQGLTAPPPAREVTRMFVSL